MNNRRHTIVFYAIMLGAIAFAAYAWSWEIRLAVRHPMAAVQTLLVRILPPYETQQQYEYRMDKQEGAQE